jgi:hypothetical protein
VYPSIVAFIGPIGQETLSAAAGVIVKGPVPGMLKPMVAVVLPQLEKLDTSAIACAKLPKPVAAVFVTQKTGVGEGGGTGAQAPIACWATAPANAATNGEYRKRGVGRSRLGARIVFSLGPALRVLMAGS